MKTVPPNYMVLDFENYISHTFPHLNFEVQKRKKQRNKETKQKAAGFQIPRRKQQWYQLHMGIVFIQRECVIKKTKQNKTITPNFKTIACL